LKSHLNKKLQYLFVQAGWNLRPISVLRVDPDGRCAAILIYGRQLVIIPFERRDAMFDEHFMDSSDIKVRWLLGFWLPSSL
jgi:hypothetical protein